MIRRLFALILLAWALGFLWFAFLLPQPMPDGRTDAVIVPTGGEGRIARGLEVLADGQAEAMLVTGVDREVKANEFAAQFDVPDAAMECCVTLGFAAVDTRSNADETARWLAKHEYTTLRLVTTDWHMRRAAGELQRTLGNDITVQRDAVPSSPSLGTLFLEYHKLLASTLARWIGL
ncbi:hypothetical protein HME9302_02563 [Alteripontixanthobacter maritimus]|uniref:DUF218 domain-containing protein n=1 Tax=Alteripontixanthobacter maritimus TaxID=2161824 RepID=A0A369Q354_9SPHN|nr:YdcF family protein [Alteripontixanthobacter maritimus]RDC58890.1 hypothetical protein HME9302_00065 [Alteripontixanthobacter maritimus]RDC61342.1 hypothetical protein HME9302_02563 [Alteripontixanthobacter maritimus]